MINSKTFALDKNGKPLVLVFSFLLLSIYLVFPTREFYWDGIIYAQFIENTPDFGAHLFHPNHLFYNVIGYIAFNAAQSFGLQLRAIYVLQFVTTIFGVLCAIVFYRISKHIFRSRYLSAAMTALLAFSAAWWRFSTDADVYIISIFFLLVGFYLVLPNKEPRPYLAAIAHSFAMFFHELAALVFPAIVLGLIFQTVSLERRKRILIVAQYGFAAFLLVFGTYCLCFYLLTGTFYFKDFAGWVFSYAPEAGLSSNLWESLSLTVRGHQKLFLDGSSRLFERNAFNIILLTVFSGAAAWFLIALGRNFRELKIWLQSFREQRIYRHQVVLLCAAWIAPYLFFLFFFLPENIFYRLFYFPALIILIGTLLAPYENLNRKRRGRLALFVLLVGLYNFLFYIQPNSQIRENTSLAVALRANNLWSEKTVVFYVPVSSFDSFDSKDRLVRYFNLPVAWKPFDSIKLKEFEAEARKIHGDGGNIWLSAAAVKKLSAMPGAAQWLTENSSAQTELDAPPLDMKYIRIVPKSAERENAPD